MKGSCETNPTSLEQPGYLLDELHQTKLLEQTHQLLFKWNINKNIGGKIARNCEIFQGGSINRKGHEKN